MRRVEPIEPEAATGKARERLDELARGGGEPGPMVRAMATAPACSTPAWISAGRSSAATSTPEPSNASTWRCTNGSAAGTASWPTQVDGSRAHGYTDEQLADVSALVALQLLTGGFDQIAGIEPTPEDAAILTPAQAPA